MRQSTIVLLVLLACTVWAAWFYTTHERYVRTQYTGYHGEARINRFLAAEMLIRELGDEADSRSSLEPDEWLPDVGDTIVVRLSSSFSLGAPRESLLKWVSDGGHLVLMPGMTSSRITDDFLKALGLRLVETETGDDDKATDEADANESEKSHDTGYAVDLGRTPYRIEPSDLPVPAVTLRDKKGAIAARREYGSGFVTLLASSVYFQNDALGDYDHARLLADVIDGYLEPGEVWFIYDARFPSLWQIIWRQAPYLVLGFAGLIVAWLWSVMPKFGPAVREGAPARRSILEHVGAAGHFSWRRGGARVLAANSAAAVMREADKRHPGIGRLPPARQAEQMARITGLPAAPILDAIHNPVEPNHRDFTSEMQLLQRIRNEL